MRLGLNLGYWGSLPVDNVALALEADRLGYHSIWTAEAYGSDAISPLVWVAAKTERINVGTGIMQMTARAPVMAAMTAATIDLLTGGRMLVGIGASGPQVVEGWHGVPYGKPVTRAREYIEIMRKVWRRDHPLVHHGEHYDIPCDGGSGLGKPLKLTIHPIRPSIPIYLAAVGPKNVELAAELADGWLPIFFSPNQMKIYREWLDQGFARAGAGAKEFDIAPTVMIRIGDDASACRDAVKPFLALYIGGMGAREKNFYFNIACRYGYEDSAHRVQDLYLSGKKMEAAQAVPDELVDEVALCGPRERIAERLQIWRDSGTTTMICGLSDLETLRVMAELVL
jgi:F420-dependent oxidoreductase-like protein